MALSLTGSWLKFPKGIAIFTSEQSILTHYTNGSIIGGTYNSGS